MWFRVIVERARGVPRDGRGGGSGGGGGRSSGDRGGGGRGGDRDRGGGGRGPPRGSDKLVFLFYEFLSYFFQFVAASIMDKCSIKEMF